MSKIPKRKKHWAKECYKALQTAIDMLSKDIPDYKDEDKIEIFKYAPGIATLNRKIDDNQTIAKACDYTANKLTQHIETVSAKKIGLHYPVIFIMCYLNAMVSFGFITEKLAREVLELTIMSYDLDSVF